MRKSVWSFAAAALLLGACAPEPEKYQGKPDPGPENNTEEPAGDISCTTTEASDIKYYEAVLNGKIGKTDSEQTVWAYFYYSDQYDTAEQLLESGTKVSATGSGTVQAVIPNLLMGKRYYFLLEAKTLEKTVRGEVVSFDVPALRCFTDDAFHITRSKASLGGGGIYDETLLGDAPLTGQLCYSTSKTEASDILSAGTRIPCELTEDGSIWADLTGLTPGTRYNFVAVLTYRGQQVFGPVKSFQTQSLPADAVDLGLSVLWTKNNLGAPSPTAFGNYYSWGEKSTKSSYTKANYTGPTHTYKENENLLPTDDVAYQASSGRRTPTAREWEELMTKNGTCRQEWTTQGGVTGIKVTSTKTGNSIFLPMAGYKNGTDLIGTGENYQSQCHYWTATLAFHNNGDIPMGFAYICKKSDSSSSYMFGSWSNSNSAYGAPIRPVYD